MNPSAPVTAIVSGMWLVRPASAALLRFTGGSGVESAT